MPYPDNYSPAAQDRFMGRNSYAEAFAADAGQNIDLLTDAVEALDQAEGAVLDFGGDMALITKAMEELERAARYYRQFVS